MALQRGTRLQLVPVPELFSLHVQDDRICAGLGFAQLPDLPTGLLVLRQHAVDRGVLHLQPLELCLDLALRHDDELLARLRAAQVDELVSVSIECHGSPAKEWVMRACAGLHKDGRRVRRCGRVRAGVRHAAAQLDDRDAGPRSARAVPRQTPTWRHSRVAFFLRRCALFARSGPQGRRAFLVYQPLYNSTRNPTHSPLGRVRSAKVRAPAPVSSLLSQPEYLGSGRPLASRTTDFMLMLHDPVASISSSCPAGPESEPRSSCKARLPT